MVRIRTEFKRAKIGPETFDDNGVTTGKQFPLKLADTNLRVLHTKYDHNDRTLASDLLFVTSDGNDGFWIRRGDTFEVIQKNRPLKKSETDELIAATKALIAGFTTGDCYKTINPYSRPYVRKALELLAKIEGKKDYLNVEIG